MEVALAKNLTSQQHAFACFLADGFDRAEAARLAGYSVEGAKNEAYRLLQQPHVIAGVQIMLAKRLAMNAPLAMNVLEDLVRDKAMHPKLRLDAAKTILDRAGHIAPKAVAASSSTAKPLNEMSMSELRELADKLENELSGRAKDVSSAKPSAKEPQTIDDIM